MSDLSPMMKQYQKIKQENEGSVLFYRLGDFYEMFFEDAELVSKELELTLTGRECGNKKRAPMCGVPYHSADAYIARLIQKGYKIAICEQMDDPSTTKGLVRREVTRIITPGTVLENSMLEDAQNNFICSFFFCENSVALSFCDVSTGELCATKFKYENCLDKIEKELIKFQPKEILINDVSENIQGLSSFIKDRLYCSLEIFENSGYDFSKSVELISLQLKNQSLSDIDNEIILSLGKLFEYLNKTQKTFLKQISLLEIYFEDQFMNVDLNTRRNLELVETMRDKSKKGSLLWALDKTRTSMGKRLIRSWIDRPLLNQTRIIRRQEAVEELMSNIILIDELSVILSGIYDLERLSSRIAYGSVTFRELNSFLFALRNLPKIKNAISNMKSLNINKINQNLDPLEDVQNLICTSILDESDKLAKEGLIIKPGYNQELDLIRSDFKNAKGILASLEMREREKTGITKLKTGYNKVFGYYIEVTNSFKSKVPEDYIRKQTLANCERYITEELKDIEIRVLGAKEKYVEVESMLFEDVKKQITQQLKRIQDTAKMVATLDVLLSFAKSALENKYCRPTITTDGTIVLKDSRHPVAELLMDGAPFVPNDVNLDNEQNRIYTITGPNMAGKSTYMRQVAVITLMAQTGSFVPASFAKIGLVDSIFTRVGASDDLLSGQSTFMVEMNEVAQILKNATNKSLIVLDEIGRGTSTFDGMSIARAVLEFIADKSKVGAKTFFATHYHEMTALEGVIEGIKNYNIAVKKRGDDITFLKRIVPGGADDSYGIDVAKLAGLPEEIISRAKEILVGIESEQNICVNKPLSSQATSDVLNEKELDVIKKLKNIDVTTLTPIESMTSLFEICKQLQNF